MLVFISLGRNALEEYWVPQVFGPQGKSLMSAYRRLEPEIWQASGRVLAAQQTAELRNLIQQWRQANPSQYYVADIRLSDFSTLRGRHSPQREERANGLLAGV